MDVERLEQYVSRCPLQLLEFRNEEGVYILSKSHVKPAWWCVRFEASWLSLLTNHDVRGLENTVTLIEQMYPDFYAWLVPTFSHSVRGLDE